MRGPGPRGMGEGGLALQGAVLLLWIFAMMMVVMVM
jgi:hypothetical protein